MEEKIKQELRWVKKNSWFSSFCFQQRTWTHAQIYPSKWGQKPPQLIMCFGAFITGKIDRYNCKMWSTWQPDSSELLHQPWLPCHCKLWVCPHGHHRQQLSGTWKQNLSHYVWKVSFKCSLGERVGEQLIPLRIPDHKPGLRVWAPAEPRSSCLVKWNAIEVEDRNWNCSISGYLISMKNAKF